MQGAGDLLLCSTPRLARALRLVRDAGAAEVWRPAQTATVAQFLDDLLERALLRGELAADALPLALSAPQERILWERAIDSVLADHPGLALFDSAGMASAAMEANGLLEEWQVALPPGPHAEETRQFLRWRSAFRALCQRHGVMEQARRQRRQIELLAAGTGRLPGRIWHAGFDRTSPLQQRLFDALVARGVEVQALPLGRAMPASAVQAAYDDADAECRAAVAWAAARLAENPACRLAIVVPELGALRRRLVALLDDVLHPAALHPARSAAPRCYDFSLGEPLAATAVATTACALLRLAAQPYRLAQQELGWLLRDVYWSAGLGEADARAQLEARMRRTLPATLSLPQVLRLARKAAAQGCELGGLLRQLEAMLQLRDAWPRLQPPSAWAAAFAQWLEAAGWPGDRALSSHEYQARQSWGGVINELAGFDALLGRVTAAGALQQLERLCRERIFQPESPGLPALQVLGLLEPLAEPLDGVWVMGMNDHLWPPPERPNPLLPAAAQRQAGAPNAGTESQAAFARIIHRRLLHAAPQVVFSWARREGERALRASPLLGYVAQWREPLPPAQRLGERLAQPAALEAIADHRAPPVAEDEVLRGGTGLLRAQAICPAWAYFRYRLGARALETPVDGLDSMARGSLLHAVLQCLWRGRDSAWLQSLTPAARQAALAEAVAQGVALFQAGLEAPLPPGFLRLETARLQALLAAWLELEQQRPAFSVQECERQLSLEIAGIPLSITLDRIDALADGALVVLDYKTGAASFAGWAEPRITEPQLPLYAALALRDAHVAAVCYARVRAEEQKFIGIADADGRLPGVKGLDSARSWFDAEQFPDWPALLARWRERIAAVAEEIRNGEAAVRFEDEAELAWCEVKPLLRLPERKLQMEREGSA